MSDALTYDAASYRNKIRMTSIKHLLVEGRDDKKLFKTLLEEILGRDHDVKIDSADSIRFGSSIGNRERVEKICNNFIGTPHENKIVGFVDREFREFEIGEILRDLINSHYVDGRVVWSRGHSIENYYFDFHVLRKPLRSFTATPFFDDALLLLEKNLKQIMCLACAASLTGHSLGLINVIKRSIDWQAIRISDSIVTLDIAYWQSFLITRQGVQQETAQKVAELFQVWLDRTEKADANLVRWLCHGHTGLAFIWSAYAACVLETCRVAGIVDYQKEARNVLKAEESVRFSVCADLWTQQACHNLSEHPIEIFRQMGLLPAS